MSLCRTLATTLGASLLVASGALLNGKEPVKVGFIYVGPVGDAGWTYQHDLGRKEMETALKGKVTTQFVESVPEGPDAERVLRNMAQGGVKIVFATSFGYMNPVLKVAAQYPDVVFMHATGYKTAKNVGIYNGRFYEGRYLCGYLAGQATKSHVAGIVAAFPIPEVVMGINAFALGMQKVDPKAEVRVVWTNSWFDPAKEREAALALIAQGADVLTHDTDSTAVIQAAEEKGVRVFGYNSDEQKFGPKAMVTSLVHTWGDYYTKVVSSVLAGTWKTENVWGGLHAGMIKMSPLGPGVTEKAKSGYAKLQSGIKDGKVHPFAGPVVDQDGKVRVAAGKVISDEDLEKMDYFVKGVASKIPSK